MKEAQMNRCIESSLKDSQGSVCLSLIRAEGGEVNVVYTNSAT